MILLSAYVGNVDYHVRLVRGKRKIALYAYEKSAFTVVGDLALKAVEQAVEAVAALRDLHLHIKPRTAHAERTKWLKSELPELSADYSIVWEAYGRLGYDGLDGRCAKEAIEATERILDAIEKRTKIKFK